MQWFDNLKASAGTPEGRMMMAGLGRGAAGAMEDEWIDLGGGMKMKKRKTLNDALMGILGGGTSSLAALAEMDANKASKLEDLQNEQILKNAQANAEAGVATDLSGTPFESMQADFDRLGVARAADIGEQLYNENRLTDARIKSLLEGTGEPTEEDQATAVYGAALKTLSGLGDEPPKEIGTGLGDGPRRKNPEYDTWKQQNSLYSTIISNALPRSVYAKYMQKGGIGALNPQNDPLGLGL